MVKQIVKNETAEESATTSALVPIDRALFGDVQVVLEARLGRVESTIEALMALTKGSVLALDTGIADHIDLYVNDARVARGEVVAVGDRYAVRIVEVANP